MNDRCLEVSTVEYLRSAKIAGSIHYVERSDGVIAGMQFICPCGCGNESWLNFRAGTPSWSWNGDRANPTLTPSVHNTGMPCQWHGWLRSGMWVAA